MAADEVLAHRIDLEHFSRVGIGRDDNAGAVEHQEGIGKGRNQMQRTQVHAARTPEPLRLSVRARASFVPWPLPARIGNFDIARLPSRMTECVIGRISQYLSTDCIL